MSVSTAKAARAAMKEKAQRLAKKPAKVKTQIDMGSMDAAQQGATAKTQKAYRTARKDGGKVHGKTAPKRADRKQRIKKQDAGPVTGRYAEIWDPMQRDILGQRNILTGALEVGGGLVPRGGAPMSTARSAPPPRQATPRAQNRNTPTAKSAPAATPASTSSPSWGGESAAQWARDSGAAAAPARAAPAAPARATQASQAAAANAARGPASAPIAPGYRALASQFPMGAYSGAGAPASVARSGLPLGAAVAGAGAAGLGLGALQSGQSAPEYMEATAPPPASALDYREATAPTPAAPRVRSTAAPASRGPSADELMEYYNAPGGRSEREMAQLAAMRNAPEAGPMKRGGAAKKKSAKKSAKGR